MNFLCKSNLELTNLFTENQEIGVAYNHSLGNIMITEHKQKLIIHYSYFKSGFSVVTQ